MWLFFHIQVFPCRNLLRNKRKVGLIDVQRCLRAREAPTLTIYNPSRPSGKWPKLPVASWKQQLDMLTKAAASDSNADNSSRKSLFGTRRWLSRPTYLSSTGWATEIYNSFFIILKYCSRSGYLSFFFLHSSCRLYKIVFNEHKYDIMSLKVLAAYVDGKRMLNLLRILPETFQFSPEGFIHHL